MKTQKALGYLIGITGLVMLGWYAYNYLSGKGPVNFSAGVALLFCLIGAALIRKEK